MTSHLLALVSSEDKKPALIPVLPITPRSGRPRGVRRRLLQAPLHSIPNSMSTVTHEMRLGPRSNHISNDRSGSPSRHIEHFFV